MTDGFLSYRQTSAYGEAARRSEALTCRRLTPLQVELVEEASRPEQMLAVAEGRIVIDRLEVGRIAALAAGRPVLLDARAALGDEDKRESWRWDTDVSSLAAIVGELADLRIKALLLDPRTELLAPAVERCFGTSPHLPPRAGGWGEWASDAAHRVAWTRRAFPCKSVWIAIEADDAAIRAIEEWATSFADGVIVREAVGV